MSSTVLKTLRVSICQLDRVSENSLHLFTREAWKNIWNDLSFCAKLAEGQLYCYDSPVDANPEKFAGVVTKIEIKRRRVYATIDLIDTDNGRRIFRKSGRRSLFNNFTISGRGSVIVENGYFIIDPETFMLESVHFVEKPIKFVTPTPQVSPGGTVVDMETTSTEPNFTEYAWNAPAGFDSGRLGDISPIQDYITANITSTTVGASAVSVTFDSSPVDEPF